MTAAGDPTPSSILEWGSAGAALERESGDLHVVAEFPGGALAAVIDGLGHGSEAAVAAREAARVLEAHPGDPLAELIQRCHEALHGTRGAVMSLASFDSPSSSMTWAGVGNVDALLLRADRSAQPAREAITLRGGVVGYQLPGVRVSTLSVSPGDTLIMVSDGIRSSFVLGIPAHWRPQDMADSILERHGRGTDDALVLVARYLGPLP
jgi:serine phosphatase RsbU (regulator of sigma subunit)